MEQPIELSLSSIVNKFPATASLFEKYDLDFCCKGKLTLKEACKDDQVKFKTVEHALHRMIENEWTNKDVVHFENSDLSDLIDHIVSKHHHYVKESMPLIFSHLEKVSTKHGDRHPELHQIYQLFAELKMDMEQHMFKEENILFPRIKEINKSSGSDIPYRITDKQFLNTPIHVMMDEHDKAGNILHEIKMLSNHYSAPENACTTYRLSFDELKEFEHDLHKHVHLENNILFPRAVELMTKAIG
ncbi:iron-sulfur cluster repair di-iron protein [soil metagenome]